MWIATNTAWIGVAVFIRDFLFLTAAGIAFPYSMESPAIPCSS